MKAKFFIIPVVLMSFQCYNSPKNEKVHEETSKVEILEPEVALSNLEPVLNQTESSTTTENEVDREELVAFAKTFMGAPYVYAEQDPNIGFDCSGFINYVFKNYDITVPRSSSGFKNFGKKIAIEEAKIGDVLIFTGYRDSTVIGHLGIISEANGLNSKFIHASSGKAMQVTISDLNSNHYSNRFLHAVDVINE
jgi:cell wall-associated NlpC family hydrolase